MLCVGTHVLAVAVVLVPVVTRPNVCVLLFVRFIFSPNVDICIYIFIYREVDLTHWNCILPGKKGTIWENGHYPLTIQFSNEYPARPPKVGCHQCMSSFCSRITV